MFKHKNFKQEFFKNSNKVRYIYFIYLLLNPYLTIYSAINKNIITACKKDWMIFFKVRSTTKTVLRIKNNINF